MGGGKTLSARAALPVRAVVFDFDLTLADSSTSILRCFAHGCRAVGHPEPDPERVRALIGMPLADMWHTLAVDPEIGVRDVEAFVSAYRERAAQHMADETRLFPATVPTLRALRAAGLSLAVVSTKIRERFEDVLERAGVLPLFSCLVGGESVSRHKPDPMGLLGALENLGVAPGDAVYVGDSTIDAETAERAGTGFVAVVTGTTPQKSFEDFPCRAVLEDLSGLSRLLGCDASS